MKPVEAMPTAGRGRQSMYVDAIAQLAGKAGQPFLVRTCNSPQSAASARAALVKAAKAAGVTVDARVSGVDLFAVARKARAKS
jgi:hypothetical protein